MIGKTNSGGGGDDTIATISVTSGANGSASPAGDVRVIKGEDKTIIFSPNSGYIVESIVVDGVSVGDSESYTFSNVQTDHTLSVTFKKAPIYGYTITMSTSSPSACISFTDDAAGMSAAERKAWAYSMVTPTVVKNGVINYKLNRSNLSQKENGGASNLTGTDGDVCASISPLWFKISKSGKVLTVKLSEHPLDGYITAHKFAGIVREYLHIGMFEASGNTCNSIYSTSVYPTYSTTLNTFRNQAQTKNAGLPEAVYNPVTYLSWVVYQALFVMAYGTLDSQGAVGNGFVGGSWNNRFEGCAVANANILTCGGEYGGTGQIMCLYVVNPWGNVWEFRDGCKWNNGVFALLTDQSDVWNIENSGLKSTWHQFTAGIGTGKSANYISEFNGNGYAGFFPSVASGSSATYACDACWSATGERCCIVGGGWNHGSDCGVFCVDVHDVPSYSSVNIGARLQILNLT